MRLSDAKTGNIRLLRELRTQMPADDFSRIGGAMLNEMGYKPATNSFSLNQFTTNWNKLSTQAKNELFSPEHRRYIDDIANLGKHLKDADQYLNTSHSSGGMALAGMTSALAAGATATATTGRLWPLLTAAAGDAGHILMGAALSRKPTAAAVARLARAERAASVGRSPAAMATLRLAERGVLATVPELQNMVQYTRDNLPFLQAPAKDQTSLPQAK